MSYSNPVLAPATFRLRDSFIAKYHPNKKTPPFGFNGFGALVYYRTYSRVKPSGENEQWFETVRRVVEGTYRMQERHIRHNDLGWSDARAQASAEEMYDRMYHMKFLPPGRGLWAMGSIITEEKGLFSALQNCAFVSTKNLHHDLTKPFTFLMDMSMLGVGVGFDCEGAGKLTIRQPGTAALPTDYRFGGLYPGLPIQEDATSYDGSHVTFCYLPQQHKIGDPHVYTIPDNREGWVLSVHYLLDAFLSGRALPQMDYRMIRPGGLPIKGFGGKSSGPEPLQQLHAALTFYLTKRVGQLISSEDIVTIQNLIGCCVVAGNVRRTAEISFGDPEDKDYLDLKNYRWDAELGQTVGPRADRAEFGWTSNNSIFAELGMDYSFTGDRAGVNGEPGFAWLENMRAYSRMGDTPPDHKDKKVAGSNPCAEQSLESYETCNLVETFPANHKDKADFLRTLKFAYLYSKTVTTAKSHWAETNRVLLRNRRIGCSQSGVIQAINKLGIEEFRIWCEEGYQTIQKYDKIYSDWLTIPLSIKTTSVKPSGTVSKLVGATAGVHFPESPFLIRRMRLSRHSELVGPLEEAGYVLEPCFGSEDSTLVVSVPIRFDDGIRSTHEVSMWEKLEIAAFMQRYWADNQVSCTVSFDPETEGPQIKHALNYYQYRLKGISFLPSLAAGAYPQMPEEAITEDVYNDLCSRLKPLVFNHISEEEADVERFCEGETCLLAK